MQKNNTDKYMYLIDKDLKSKDWSISSLKKLCRANSAKPCKKVNE